MIETPLGPLVAGATSKGICLLEFTDRRMLEAQIKTLRRRFGGAIVPGRNRHLDRLRRQLRDYFAGTRRTFDLPLVAPGSPFQERVWEELARIPVGETRSYEEIAKAIGSPKAVRAVGTANGMNRIAILIPCHRVVTKDGQLGGYGGGKWRKAALLELERNGIIPT
jgi:AraC family transcriptional regulator of adaptative response/methylated-DNA-[protein]-cysteine methyltransferase